MIDQAGNQLTELDGSGQWVHSNVFANGELLATYNSSPAGVFFHLSDWLGTRRIQTDTNGVQTGSYFSYPFGDGLSTTGSDSTEYHFADLLRDTESSLDSALFRQYGSVQGRWLRPDPAWMVASDIDNPQTGNQYAHVLNNPLRYIDPPGEYHCEDGNGDTQDNCNNSGGMWASDPGDPDYCGNMCGDVLNSLSYNAPLLSDPNISATGNNDMSQLVSGVVSGSGSIDDSDVAPDWDIWSGNATLWNGRVAHVHILLLDVNVGLTISVNRKVFFNHKLPISNPQEILPTHAHSALEPRVSRHFLAANPGVPPAPIITIFYKTEIRLIRPIRGESFTLIGLIR